MTSTTGRLRLRAAVAVLGAALGTTLLLAGTASAQGSPAPGSPPPPGTGDVAVTGVSCASVTARGSGWGETLATIELVVPVSEAEERSEDLAAGPVQVFRDDSGALPETELRFAAPPPDGRYAVVVLVDGILRARSGGFELEGCTSERAELAFTGSSSTGLALVGLGAVTVGLVLVAGGRRSTRRA